MSINRKVTTLTIARPHPDIDAYGGNVTQLQLRQEECYRSISVVPCMAAAAQAARRMLETSDCSCPFVRLPPAVVREKQEVAAGTATRTGPFCGMHVPAEVAVQKPRLQRVAVVV